MPNPLREFRLRRRYGEPVIIVSGLPRSGTSMMMKMLAAGGIPIATDEARAADEDNPRGYFELERVKELDKGGDKSWLGGLRGRAVKIISFLLKDLPPDLRYRIIFMERDLDEVIASQNAMLARRGEPVDPEADGRMKRLYTDHLRRVRLALLGQPNIEWLAVNYRRALDDPRRCARELRRFLRRRLDLEAVAIVAEPGLHRQRKNA